MYRHLHPSRIVAVLILLLGGCSSNKNSGFVLPALHPKGPTELQPEYDASRTKYDELAKRVAEHPDDHDALTQEAQLFISEARASGDHHYYYPAAMRTIDEALRLAPSDFVAVATKASLLMTFHRFGDAVALIDPVAAKNAFNAFVSSIQIDALIETGEYDRAVRCSDSLLAKRPGLPAYARAAYLRELFGDMDGAKNALRLAADAGVGGHEDRAWTLCQYANLFLQTGAADTAEFLYRGVLDERPGYAPALMGLANVRSANEDAGGAIASSAQAAQNSRDHVALEQLAGLYRVLRQPAAADTLCAQVIASFEQHEREGWQIDREYAQFCADQGIHLDSAMARAKRDYDRRPNNIDAAQTYSWTLFRNGKSSDALPIIDRAMRMNSQSPLVLFTAAMVHRDAGDSATAATLLARITGHRAFLPPIHADIARHALAQLNHEG